MPVLPHPLTRLLGATLPDGRTVDVDLADGRVAAVHPAGSDPVPSTGDPETGAEDGHLDLTGFLLLPAPAEPHAHLDKALSWDLIRPPMGDLRLAIESWSAYARTMTTEGILERAGAAARMMLQAGTTAVRTHVDVVDGPQPMRGVRALTALREHLAGLMEIQIVALVSQDTPDEIVHQALDLGVDLVGGAPHLAKTPLEDLERLLRIADQRGVGVDLHTDEGLSGEPTFTHYARAVRDWPAGRIRSAGHCVRQGALPAAELGEAVAAARAGGLGVISLPITNLYLQGWDQPVSTPRGLTALRAFLDAGVPVAAGADNLRDPFNPVGRADALETASLLITAGHLTLDEAYHAVSGGARAVLGLEPAGPEPGARADLLAVRAGSLGEAVGAAPPDRIVIHRGRLVSRSRSVHETAWPVGTPA